MKYTKPDDIAELLVRVTNKVLQREKIPHDYGMEEIFYKAETNIIDFVGKNPGINVTSLAEKVGVTKGAVSQIIKKIEPKGVVIKSNPPDNDKEICLYLTEKGKIVFDRHSEFHRNLNKAILDKMKKNGLSYDAFNVIGIFFGIMDELLDNNMNDLPDDFK